MFWASAAPTYFLFPQGRHAIHGGGGHMHCTHPSVFPMDISIFLQILSFLQASFMESIAEEDLRDASNPTGKLQTKVFFVKYNVSVAAATFSQKK